jgi:phosphohistidine phosphatase
MKQILLMRHAKSSWDDATLPDIERPLAPRGREAAAKMGGAIARRGWIPARALVSPSRRTRQTWSIVSRDWTAVPDVAFPAELYEASSAALLLMLRGFPERAEGVLVIGHNPGMEDLAKSLCGPGSGKAAAELNRKFPTAALARFVFDARWSQLGQIKVQLTDFVRPRDL